MGQSHARTAGRDGLFRNGPFNRTLHPFKGLVISFYFSFVPFSSREMLFSSENFPDLIDREAISFNHGGIVGRKKPCRFTQGFQKTWCYRQIFNMIFYLCDLHQESCKLGRDGKLGEKWHLTVLFWQKNLPLFCHLTAVKTRTKDNCLDKKHFDSAAARKLSKSFWSIKAKCGYR